MSKRSRSKLSRNSSQARAIKIRCDGKSPSEKLKIVLQVRENTRRNHVQESQVLSFHNGLLNKICERLKSTREGRVSSVRSGLKNKILEMYMFALGN